jgi:hypothetical protein
MKSSNADSADEVYAVRMQDDQRCRTDEADIATPDLYRSLRADFAPPERLSFADVVTSMPWKLVAILVAIVAAVFAIAAACGYAAYRDELARVSSLRERIEQDKQRLRRLARYRASEGFPISQYEASLRHRVNCLEHDKNLLIAQNEAYHRQKKSVQMGLVSAVTVLFVLLGVRLVFAWSWRARRAEPD